MLQVVMEYEGVVVEETTELHREAWRQLAEEEGKSVPLQWALKRADGMKAEQVRCSGWSDPSELDRGSDWQCKPQYYDLS